MSSNNMNNFTPLPGARRTGVRAYDAHLFNNNSNEVPVFFRSHSISNEVPVFYRSHSSQATYDRVSGVLDQRQLREDRTPTGFHSITNLLSQPRQQLNAQNRDMGRRGFNRRLREILQQSTPRSTLQIINTQVVPPVVENSRSTALSKLKKEIYNPTPKNLARKLSSYYRDNNYKAANALKEVEKEMDEDGKRCAICLEDFQPKEEVMITPCKHLFHEDCIVPWLTSKGQCPVCRSVICERVRGNTSSLNINDIANMEPSDLIAGELFSILGALEAAFRLGNATH